MCSEPRRIALLAALAFASPSSVAAAVDPLDPGAPEDARAAGPEPPPLQSTPATDTPQLWLRVRGGYVRGSDPMRRVYGLLELGVDFDVFAAPVPLAPAVGEDTTDVEPGTAPASFGAAPASFGAAASMQPARPPDVTRGSLALPASGPAPALPARALPPLPRPVVATASLRITPAFARAALEAAVRVLQQSSSSARLESMASRARGAAALPELRLGAGTSRDESLRLSPTLSDPARFTRDGGRDLWFEGRLTWQLDRALFSRDELAIERLKAQLRDDRTRLVREVTDALLDWQRARFGLAAPLASEADLQAASLAELGATARLDALTDGWFSRELERNGARLAVQPSEHYETPMASEIRPVLTDLKRRVDALRGHL